MSRSPGDILPSNADRPVAEPEMTDSVPWWANLLASAGDSVIRGTLWLLSSMLDGIGR